MFEEFDLSKKYPNYFNKTIIRSFLFIAFILTALGLYLNGGLNSFYMECDTDGESCINPFYCGDYYKVEQQQLLNPTIQNFNECIVAPPEYCVYYAPLCDDKYIQKYCSFNMGWLITWVFSNRRDSFKMEG